MEYTIPDYYSEFQCVAGRCPETCCAGWEIVIDKKMQKKYWDYPGGFGNRLHNSINWREGIFKQHGMRCAFLNDENLCDIYAEAGRDMLCRTCRRYPRHYEEFENLREISLSVSCPEVARMLLDRKETVTFETVYQEKEEESYEEYDVLLFTKLQDTRELLFKIAQNRSRQLSLRMALILALSHDLQKRIREHRLFEVDDLLERYYDICHNASVEEIEHTVYRKIRKAEDFHKVQGEAVRYWHQMYQSLYRFEPLQRSWKPDLAKWEQILFGQDGKSYQDVLHVYHQGNPAWEVQGEQLLVYFLFTYFCGAVYDEDAFSKAKAALVHTLLLENIFAADMALHGSRYDRKQQERCLYRYAREVEHSQPNLLRVEEYMKHDRCFALDRLLLALAENN